MDRPHNKIPGHLFAYHFLIFHFNKGNYYNRPLEKILETAAVESGR